MKNAPSRSSADTARPGSDEQDAPASPAPPQGEREAFEGKLTDAMWRMYCHGAKRNAASAQREFQALGMFLRGAEIPAWGASLRASPAVPVAQDERPDRMMPGIDGRAEKFCAWLDEFKRTHGGLTPAIGDAFDAAYRMAWNDRAALSASTQPAAPICWAMACSNRLEQPPEWLDRAQPAVSAEARDAARFDWYFSDKPKGDFLMTYLDGMKTGWTTDQWRSAIDAAMGTPPADKENGND